MKGPLKMGLKENFSQAVKELTGNTKEDDKKRNAQVAGLKKALDNDQSYSDDTRFTEGAGRPYYRDEPPQQYDGRGGDPRNMRPDSGSNTNTRPDAGRGYNDGYRGPQNDNYAQQNGGYPDDRSGGYNDPRQNNNYGVRNYDSYDSRNDGSYDNGRQDNYNNYSDDRSYSGQQYSDIRQQNRRNDDIQRNDYPARNDGYDNYDNSGYNQRGYEDGRQNGNYDNRQQGVPYDNRQQNAGYDNRQQSPGYDNRQQNAGYDNRQQGAYDNRQQGAGYDNRQQNDGYNARPQNDVRTNAGNTGYNSRSFNNQQRYGAGQQANQGRDATRSYPMGNISRRDYREGSDNELTVISRNTIIEGNVRSFASMSIDGDIRR